MTPAPLRHINFIERYIKHIEGAVAGKPFILEPWQREIVSDLFGTFRPDGFRQYRKAYIQVPRGNGKSTLIGALCNAGLFVDGEDGALICYAALNRVQANDTGFRIVSEQIRANPKLSEIANVIEYKKTINYRPKSSSYKPMSVFKTVSRESKGLHGLNPHIAIIDEYHTHPTSDVLDTLATGMLKRRQPLLIIITTAGFNMDGPCFKEYNYAKRVASGEIKDDSYYVRIYEADREDDITDEQTWIKANPNYGVSVFRDYFEQELNRVQNEPSYEPIFRVLHLNQWMQHDTPWIRDDVWMRGSGELPQLNGAVVHLGLDISQSRDMTALSMVAKDGDRYYSWNWFWMPKKKLRDTADYKNAMFADWVRDGHITLVDGDTVDLWLIIDKINEIADRYVIGSVQYDPYNAQLLAAQLKKRGHICVPHRQGFLSLSMPTKAIENLIVRGEFVHGGNPVLRWMAGNAVAKYDEAMNIKIHKNPREPQRKVDGIITNIMALSGYLQEEYELISKTGGSYMDDMDMAGV